MSGFGQGRQGDGCRSVDGSDGGGVAQQARLLGDQYRGVDVVALPLPRSVDCGPKAGVQALPIVGGYPSGSPVVVFGLLVSERRLVEHDAVEDSAGGRQGQRGGHQDVARPESLPFSVGIVGRLYPRA